MQVLPILAIAVAVSPTAQQWSLPAFLQRPCPPVCSTKNWTGLWAECRSPYVCPQSLQGSLLSCASGHVTCCPLRPLAATTSPRKSAETNRQTSVSSYHQSPQTARSQGCTPSQAELPGAPGQTQACTRSLIPSELFSALWWVMTPLFSFCNFTVDLLWELAGDRPHVQSSFSWYHVFPPCEGPKKS